MRPQRIEKNGLRSHSNQGVVFLSFILHSRRKSEKEEKKRIKERHRVGRKQRAEKNVISREKHG